MRLPPERLERNIMIVFSGLEFIFRFLPVFLLAFYLTPVQYRDAVLFLGSVLFYGTGEPHFVALLLALILWNWWAGGRIAAGKFRKFFFVFSVLLNVGALIVCKLLAVRVSSTLLPLGMSFYIFKMVSYLADLYQGRLKKSPKFISAAAYFSMFPQITQGPIMRYAEGGFSGERNAQGALIRRYSWERFEDGVMSFAAGAAMKVLLADRIAILWNELSKIGYESISTPLAWMGAYGYSFRLYYDFWAYSLMAAGLGMMLGFPFIRNFSHPYAAGSVSQFYRDWHRTLGAWFRDYVYFPLGGSRCKPGRQFLNLMTVWLLTGFWHGGTLNFLLWGGGLGLLIVWEKLVLRGVMKKIPLLGRFHVLVLIPLSWVLFAISDLKELAVYFSRLFPFFGESGNVAAGDAVRYMKVYWPLFAASALLAVPAVSNLALRVRKSLPARIALCAAFWYAVYYMANSGSNPFLYFQF